MRCWPRPWPPGPGSVHFEVADPKPRAGVHRLRGPPGRRGAPRASATEGAGRPRWTRHDARRPPHRTVVRRRATSGSSPAGSTASASGRAPSCSRRCCSRARRRRRADPARGPPGGPRDRDQDRRRRGGPGARRSRRRGDGRVPQRAARRQSATARGRSRSSRLDDPGGGDRRRRATARVAGAVLIERTADGRPRLPGASPSGALGQDRAQLLQVGAFAVGILDWTASQPPTTDPFVVADVRRRRRGRRGGGRRAGPRSTPPSTRAGGSSASCSSCSSFLTLVFYGLWVASGVVAEKASRVMELLISAATAPQLVVGKIAGIGLAGLTQVSLVLAAGDPRAARCRASSANAVLGRGPGGAASLAGLSPGLLGGVPRVLRARVRALRGAVRGRGLAAEPRRGPADRRAAAVDPRDHGLPAGGARAVRRARRPFIRFASYVPLWSPFVMMARLSVGPVEPWELALSLGLLIVTVPARDAARDPRLPGRRAAVRPAADAAARSLRAVRGLAAGCVAGSSSNGQAPEQREDRRGARSRRLARRAGLARRRLGRRAPGSRGPTPGSTATARSCTPGRYGLVRRLASTPAMPWADTAVVERAALARDRRDHDHLVARPQDAPQDVAPLVQRLVQEPAPVEVEEVEHEAAPPAGPGARRAARGARRRRRGRARPRRPARRRAPRTGRRPAPRARPAPGGASASSRPAASTSRTSPSPARSAGFDERERRGGRPRWARTGSPGNRTASGCGVGHIGATSPGRGSAGSSRKESCSAIAARW